jgi:antitoxin HigA-1
LQARILIRLDALDASRTAEDMNLRGFDFHALRRFVPLRYTVHINGPWCMTFEFDKAMLSRSISSNIIEKRLTMSSIAKTHSASFRTLKSYKAQRNPGRKPTHPGALLRDEVLPALGVSVSQAAEQMQITRQTLHRILAERSAVTAAMALRLGKFCGNGPALWLGMQNLHDLWHEERALKDTLVRIKTMKAA